MFFLGYEIGSSFVWDDKFFNENVFYFMIDVNIYYFIIVYRLLIIYI